MVDDVDGPPNVPSVVLRQIWETRAGKGWRAVEEALRQIEG